MKRQRIFGQATWLTFALCAITLGATLLPHRARSPIALGQTVKAPLRVLIIGGSAALGWKDTGWMDWKRGWQGGYLVRSFHELSHQTQQDFVVFDKAIPGLNGTLLATRFGGRYEAWLKTIHPNFVVISWGMMNDTRPHTPMATFTRAIQTEIREALQQHAEVLVVTPPITTASYTLYQTEEPAYVAAEVLAARSLHDTRVHVIDLFNQMKATIAARGTSYRKYEGDVIHPNALGHLLASQLLVPQLKPIVT